MDADGDTFLDGVPLGAAAVWNATILIGSGPEEIEEITLDFAPATSGNASLPNFKLKAQPVINSTTTFVSTFDSSTSAASGSGNGILSSRSVDGAGQVRVTVDISLFSTSPATLPSTLPGDFSGQDATTAITYKIEVLPDLCQAYLQTPCAVNNNIAENYDLIFSVKQPSLSAVTTSTRVTIVEVPTLDLSVTVPTAAQGFNAGDLADLNFDGLVQEILFQGTVNDGGVPQVTLAGTLAGAALMGGPDTSAPTGPFTLETSDERDAVVLAPIVPTADEWQAAGLWHDTDETPPFLVFAPYVDDHGFYYGQDPDSSPSSGAFNYDTPGLPNSGALISPEFTPGSGSVLKFSTWWDTEFSTFFDSKKIKYCTGTVITGIGDLTCTDIAQITGEDPSFFFDPFFDPFGGGGSGSEPGSTFDGSLIGFPGLTMVFVPPFFGGPTFFPAVPVEVELDLIDILGSGIIGDTDAHIVFEFDTVDSISNFFIGWYVDDVLVEGEGTIAGAGFAVDPFTDPTWEGVFTPAEGENNVEFFAKRTKYLIPGEGSVNDTPTASSTIQFFLDTVVPADPVVDAPDLLSLQVANPTTAFVTSATTIGLAGEFSDDQPDTLVVTRRTTAATKPITTAILDAAFATSSVKSVFTLKDSSGDFDPVGTTFTSGSAGPASLSNTTLAQAAVAGADTIDVVSAAGLTVNNVVAIDVRSKKEYRGISSISGTTLTLDSTLSSSHSSGVAVAERQTISVADAGTDFVANKFIQVDEGPSAEVLRIVYVLPNTGSDTLALDGALSKSHGSSTPVTGAENSTWKSPSTPAPDIVEGYNQFTIVLEDKGNNSATTTVVILRDNTDPTGQVKVVTIVSDGEAVVGDEFFLIVSAADNESAISSVTEDATSANLVTIDGVEDILVEMHVLGTVNPTTTHATLITVQSGTPVGENVISVTISDTAENTVTATTTLDVVSSRTNRNFFLFGGINYTGLALIPDDGDAATTDDADLDRLMDQNITNLVDAAYAAGHTHVGHSTSGVVTLGDIVESTFAFDDSVFKVHTPGAAADTLTDLEPFVGMIMKTRETDSASSTLDVFKKVSVSGFTAQQSVPVKMNILGVFFQLGQFTPPEEVLETGYNLVAPHILGDDTFDNVYRGALIPDELAVSAIAFERRVDASTGTSTVDAEIFEGFVVQSLGELLKPVLSYWTFIVSGTPTITP